MIQTKAAYRNSSETESRNSHASASCRKPVASPAKNSLSSQFADPKSFAPPTVQEYAEFSQLVSDLDQLVAMGLLETFQDQYRITRYRPTNGRRIV